MFDVVGPTWMSDIKQKAPVKKMITVSVKEHHPYCGGAPPPKANEGGFTSFLVYQNFFIKEGLINNEKIPVLAEVTTDSTGRFSIALDTGQYMLIFPEKHSSFQDFYQSQSKESRVLQAGPIDCFRAWWQRPDATSAYHRYDITTSNASFEPPVMLALIPVCITPDPRRP